MSVWSTHKTQKLVCVCVYVPRPPIRCQKCSLTLQDYCDQTELNPFPTNCQRPMTKMADYKLITN